MKERQEKTNGTVSIIVPVYDVERYLKQCLESIASQTYQDLEILVIDDESPDQCGLIADEYAQKDSRFRVFHIKNRGAAGARNVGLENCTGQFVMFVDSDDWLEKDAVETLVDLLLRDNADIVQCQYYSEYVNRSVLHQFIPHKTILTSSEYIEEMMKTWEYVLLWNKLYKSTVITGLKMIEGHCIDDEFFTYKTVVKATNISLVQDCLYHYRMRKSGATTDPEKKSTNT